MSISNKKITAYRIISVLLYFAGIAALAFYAVLSFHPRFVLSPAGRLCFLGMACVAMYAASVLICKTVGYNTSLRIMKVTFLLFFILYIMLLVTLVLFDSYFGRTGFGIVDAWNSPYRQEYMKDSVNLIPFDTVWCFVSGLANSAVTPATFAVNIFGNLLAFAPFAFFLPLFWKAQRKTWVFLVTMVSIVVAVEISQLILLTGFCDIDDLILNVGGAWVLYAILRIKPIANLIIKFTKIT